MAYDSLMVFTGNANPRLAADIAKRLNISLGRASVGRFSDGEATVEIPVRGDDWHGRVGPVVDYHTRVARVARLSEVEWEGEPSVGLW